MGSGSVSMRRDVVPSARELAATPTPQRPACIASVDYWSLARVATIEHTPQEVQTAIET